jgi:hypothetical protein
MGVKVDLDRWMPHLAAAKREGKTLNAYARSCGLSPCTLYAAQQMLRGMSGAAPERRGRVQRVARKRGLDSAFATVALAVPAAPLISSGARLQARLPNGVMLELAGGEAALLVVAIQALARQ